MKKLVALVLSLCLMYSVGIAASTQKINVGIFDFQIPDNMQIVNQDISPLAAMVVATQGADTMLGLITGQPTQEEIQIISEGFTDTEDINFQEWYSLLLWQATLSPLGYSPYEMRYEERDIGMLNGESVILATASNDHETVFSCSQYVDGKFFFLFEIAPTANSDESEKNITAIALSCTPADASAALPEIEDQQQYVIITNSSANIRSGPGGDYAKVTTAVKGDTFPLIREEGNWYVIDVNGQTGYVTKSLSAIQ